MEKQYKLRVNVRHNGSDELKAGDVCPPEHVKDLLAQGLLEPVLAPVGDDEDADESEAGGEPQEPVAGSDEADAGDAEGSGESEEDEGDEQPEQPKAAGGKRKRKAS